MEFGEKLQALRKERGLTQEELGAALFVSRTAISKWESGRGYPGIESLKGISAYFSVSIDDLLSSETLIQLAEAENRVGRERLLGLFFGLFDLSSLLLMLLPLYPYRLEGYVYGVSLFAYGDLSAPLRFLYAGLFLCLALLGVLKLLSLHFQRGGRSLEKVSMVLGSFGVILLGLGGESYAVTLLFLLLLAKAALLYRRR